MSSASLASSEPPAIGADVRRGRRTLLLLALVCLLPVLASYLAFYVWPPQGRVNHGRLIGPLALPAGTLAGAGGQPALAHEEFEGRWTLLVLAPGHPSPFTRTWQIVAASPPLNPNARSSTFVAENVGENQLAFGASSDARDAAAIYELEERALRALAAIDRAAALPSGSGIASIVACKERARLVAKAIGDDAAGP